MAQTKNLSQLQDNKLDLVLEEGELDFVLDRTGVPVEYREYITGTLVEVVDGDYGKVLCDLSGCWRIASVTGHDAKNHIVRACDDAHKRQVMAHRAKVYGSVKQ